MATGEIAVPTFSALLASDHEVVALVTQPDKPFGRRQEMRPPQVKILAESAGVPVFQPETVRKKEILAELRTLAPEIIVVMAYGQILPQSLIDIPKNAIINLHASLLPKYRGASCIQAAIVAGDEFTGWTAMHVVKALDAGDIILQKKIKIGEKETGGELHDRLAMIAPECLLETLRLLAAGNAERRPQDDALSSYAPKLNREDGEIDWSMSAEKLARLVRAYDPWPGTSTCLQMTNEKKKRLKIFPPVELGSGEGESGQLLSADENGFEIATGKGSVFVREAQLEGCCRMSAADLFRGHGESLKSGGLK